MFSGKEQAIAVRIPERLVGAFIDQFGKRIIIAEEMENMSKQFEEMLGSMSLDGGFDFENEIETEDEEPGRKMGLGLHNLFSNPFASKSNESDVDSSLNTCVNVVDDDDDVLLLLLLSCDDAGCCCCCSTGWDVPQMSSVMICRNMKSVLS